MVIVLTNVAVADEPAHSASAKPMLITSARPPDRTSRRIGAITFCTTSSLNARLSVFSICVSVRVTVPLPNHLET
jgi:hypothetical protein